MKVTLYGTTTSYWSNELKAYLEKKKISFEEKLLDQNEEAVKELKDINSGFLGVPFILVEKDDGTKDRVVGYDKGRLNMIFT